MGARLSSSAKDPPTLAPSEVVSSDTIPARHRKHPPTFTKRASVPRRSPLRPSHTSSDMMISISASTSSSSRGISTPPSASLPASVCSLLPAETRLVSLASALRATDPTHYVWIGGRNFHHEPDSVGLLPCDEEENRRLAMQHIMVRFVIQGNYLAPMHDHLRRGAIVLDAACRPGSWSLEIAGEYPKSKVIGVDRLPTLPKCTKPVNCSFRQCNILTGVPFEDATFDYISMRFVSHTVQSSRWKSLIEELVRVLKKGGWIELVEMSQEMYRAGPSTHEHNHKLLTLLEKRGLDVHAGQLLHERLEAHPDLSKSTSAFVSCPGGQWAGKLGQLTLQSWKAYYNALRPQMCLDNNISEEEYDALLRASWSEVDEYQTFENVHFAYAQKKTH